MSDAVAVAVALISGVVTLTTKLVSGASCDENIKLGNASNSMKNNLLIKSSRGVINAFIISTNTIALAGPILSENSPQEI